MTPKERRERLEQLSAILADEDRANALFGRVHQQIDSGNIPDFLLAVGKPKEGEIRVIEGDLVYMDGHPQCFRIITTAQGEKYAFVQVIDANSGQPKRYWGRWDSGDEKESMLEILRCGGKWPDLPPTANG